MSRDVLMLFLSVGFPTVNQKGSWVFPFFSQVRDILNHFFVVKFWKSALYDVTKGRRDLSRLGVSTHSQPNQAQRDTLAVI